VWLFWSDRADGAGAIWAMAGRWLMRQAWPGLGVIGALVP
jgi:hypothetical protein